MDGASRTHTRIGYRLSTETNFRWQIIFSLPPQELGIKKVPRRCYINSFCLWPNESRQIAYITLQRHAERLYFTRQGQNWIGSRSVIITLYTDEDDLVWSLPLKNFLNKSQLDRRPVLAASTALNDTEDAKMMMASDDDDGKRVDKWLNLPFSVKAINICWCGSGGLSFRLEFTHKTHRRIAERTLYPFSFPAFLSVFSVAYSPPQNETPTWLSHQDNSCPFSNVLCASSPSISILSS